MPRVPVRVQAQLGTTNPNAKTGRSLPQPSIAMRGPSQQRETFAGLPENIARALQRLQNAIAQAVSVATRLPFADCNMIQGVSFSAGSNTTINHGLGRAYQGYMVVNVTVGGGSFYAAAQSPASLNDSQITLHSANTCMGDVLVW